MVFLLESRKIKMIQTAAGTYLLDILKTFLWVYYPRSFKSFLLGRHVGKMKGLVDLNAAIMQKQRGLKGDQLSRFAVTETGVQDGGPLVLKLDSFGQTELVTICKGF